MTGAVGRGLIDGWMDWDGTGRDGKQLYSRTLESKGAGAWLVGVYCINTDENCIGLNKKR